MDKKKILIGLGVVALIGGIFYFYNKSKSSQSDSSSSDSSAGTSAGTPPTGTPPIEEDDKTPPAKVLETRKEKRKACGRKPMAGKKKKELWQKCVDEGGTSEFTGDFDEFEESYLDFDNNFDISF